MIALWLACKEQERLATEARRLAEDAMQRRKFAKALCEYGHVFDLLMVGVHMQRKQMQHDTRWGKGSNSAVKTKPQ